MSRSTFSVLFYANKSKVKNGIVPVMGRITINGTQSQFSCKRSIPLSLWDAKGNCAKGRTREALDLNRDLDNIKAQIIKHYQHLSDREAFVTAEMVRNAYQGFGSEYETLLRAFDKDCESLKQRVGKDRALGTYKLQVRSRNYVADFLQMNYRRSDISMQELTPDFIKEFAVYLANDRGLASSTIWLSCMHLKGVVGRAHDNGKIQRNVFALFHISPKCKERTFLTEEELRTVMEHEFEDTNLAFIRDLFVFMNFTALSFVDLKELTTDNIVEVNGEKWIAGKRHKTGVPYQVKLLAVPLQIIERYRDYPKENPKSVFGEVNYWSVCKKLKPVMKECGIDKPISAHCARHGFATMALTNGMPIESVSRVLGHTNIVTTQIYARITTQKLDNDLTMLGNKLNVSFNNIKLA
ncbi:tyrosine-type recombinase/integrase [Segatella copri]|uniref:site-specific integrase n=1 Tax=Segatella copri TaxID=165179 RepID=UPI003CFD2FA1